MRARYANNIFGPSDGMLLSVKIISKTRRVVQGVINEKLYVRSLQVPLN